VKQIKEISPAQKYSLSVKLLNLARHFDQVSILNSNDYADKYGKYEIVAAFGAHRSLSAEEASFESLKRFYGEKAGWLFGHLSYELKDQLEALESRHPKQFDFAPLGFFEPTHLLVWKRGAESGHWYSHQPEELEALLESDESLFSDEEISLSLKPQLSKSEYLDKVEALKSEIKYGNIYEVNFCQTFSAETELDPYAYYSQLSKRSAMPFSAFYKQASDFLLCASPERFICKRGEKLICQPIKGTAKRSADPEEDARIARDLRADLKEQTENVMIVDLMRNDLSQTAARGSVQVEELFGVYTFPQVHQLISTVSSKLDKTKNPIDAIKLAFPMGSMTGAPKIKAMELIESHEVSRRELYSGAVGYFDPEGDFDFNVVIRSLLYSAKKNFASLTVGGAITDLANAEQEYQECLLKAKAIFEASDKDQHVKSPR
jgi:para-aminobenzoate synthetase component 1